MTPARTNDKANTNSGNAAGTKADGGSRSGLRRTLMISELLDAATKLFAEQGYEATSVGDIAKALGISRPALYTYVNNKEDLLGMLVDQVSDGFAEVLAELAGRRDISAEQKIADVVALMVRQRAQHPDQFRILDRSEPVLTEELASKHLAAKRNILRELATVIDAGIEAGEFRRVDTRITALSLLGMCNWVAWWFRPGSDIQGTVDVVTDLVHAMLATKDAVARNQSARTIDQIRGLLDQLDQQS